MSSSRIKKSRWEGVIMHEIIDVPSDIGEFADQLADAGVKTVIRYYNHRNSSHLPSKALTQRELDKLFHAGLSVAVVFQQRGGAGGNLTDLSATTGDRDAVRALELAAALHQPDGSAIYFGVDHDYFRASELAQIKAYFQAARARIDGRYRVGVYGSGTVGTTLKRAGTVDLIWLAAARGWSGTRQALESGDWTLDQRFLELRSEIGGFIYDGNVFNPAAANFGQFGPGGGVDSPAGQGVAMLYEVIARSGLNLRPIPDTESRVIQSLPLGTVVRGLARTGEWIKADLNGDGLADGYLFLAFLRPVSGGLPLPPPAGSRRPMDIARAELALDVREVAGAQNNPRITMYHASTSGGAAPDETAWCSSFANYCVEQAGLNGTNSKWARSWHDSRWGSEVTNAPQEGDIVVWRRHSQNVEGGHVAFFVDADADSIRVLGGNQGNRVSITRFPRNGQSGSFRYDLLSIRRS
jgi:uncharacterized protein (TIGR02594 family)